MLYLAIQLAKVAGLLFAAYAFLFTFMLITGH